MFKLTTDEILKVQKFEKEHECKFRNNKHGVPNEIYVGAIGGTLTYSFTPTGLGITTKVKCCCGEELDLTDYDSW